MIKDRPKHLLDDPTYSRRPATPYGLNWESVPEIIRVSTLDLGGIQPITRTMMELAGGTLYDKPSEAEVAYFKERGTQFQMLSLVASVVADKVVDGVQVVRPFALSLLPASKRNAMETVSIEHIATVDGGQNWNATDPCYVGYDPFAGEWEMYGPAGLLLSEPGGFLDEVGLVVETFFLATEFDPAEVLMVDAGMPAGKMREKYRRKRSELLFRPFKKVEARRIWGAETPIELFLIQELARHGYHPTIQMLIMDDGGLFPSLYHLWQDMEFRHMPGLVTEVDLFFPEQRIAVFCDGAHHDRKPQRIRDEAITAKLAAMNIRSVRVPGRMINGDLHAAGRLVLDALDGC